MNNDFITKELNKIAKELIEKGKSEAEINNFFTKVTSDMITKLGKKFLKELKKNAEQSIREHDLINKAFLSRLEFRWYKAFDLLEILINVSLEVIQEIYDEYNYNSSKKDNKYLFEAFFRLHARAIHIAKEIQVLIKNGYADGAMARWRSLFEICAIVIFIDKHGEDLAQKYIEYQAIENHNEMLEYQERCEQLGFEKISETEVALINEKKEKLEKKYSSEYSKTYGWTYEVLSPQKRKISGIIEDIQFELWKPYYKMACNFIHSGPKALYFNLSSMNSNMLLVGPSNIGFTEPVQNTAISLVQITSIIISRMPNDIRIVILESLNQLVPEIGEIFDRIQKEIEKEEHDKK